MQNIQEQISWENMWNTIWCLAYRSEKAIYSDIFGGLNSGWGQRTFGR